MVLININLGMPSINQCISLNIEIQHIAESLGANTRESYISTIAEFFILMKAKTIFMCGSYTGFSHIAAVIGRKPFYVTTRTDYFRKLGPVEIYDVCINPIKISPHNKNDIPSKSLKILERHNIKKEFDILIVVGEKDYDCLKYIIEYAVRNVVGYNKIYLIPSDMKKLYDIDTTDVIKNNCVIINENSFPFTINDIANIF